MNTELTTDQIKTIFVRYWGQKVLMPKLNADRLSVVDVFTFMQFRMDYKLALIPLEKITDGHAIDFVCNSHYNRIIENPIVKHLPSGINVSNGSGGVSIFWHGITWKEYAFLCKLGYDVPVFIDIDHPANGKTAIELDIAIDKTLITFIN